jgi:hypothetical protein
MPLGVVPGFRRGSAGAFTARSNYYGAGDRRRPGTFRFRDGIPYLLPAWGGYLGTNYSGYPYESGDDDSAAQEQTAYPETYGLPSASGALGPSVLEPAPAGVPRQASIPASEDAVTLVFKDGRPTEQIHNYALTRTTLYVRDEHHRDIPLDLIDLTATQKVNREAGVDFQLPEIPK